MIAMMKKMQFHQLDHIDRDDYEGGDETDDEDWLSYKPLSKEVLRKDTSYRHRAVLLSVRSTVPLSVRGTAPLSVRGV
jgi:hypothetical protein